MTGGQIHSGLPWTEGPAPIIGDGWVQLGGPTGKKIFFDELSKADQDLVLQYLLSAQFPILSPPQTQETTSTSSVGSIAQMEQKKHEIITQMLDSWLASLEKIAQENKRAAEKLALNKLEIAYHEFKKQQTDQPNELFPVFALGFIIIGTGIQQALTPDPTTGVQLNPIINMNTEMLPPVLGDMRAELGLIGALFSAGIQYFTVAQIASKLANGKEAPKDATFAKGYAENILALVGTLPFNSYLMAIVSKSLPKETTVAPQKAIELVASLKIVLLSAALAMLYQVETGRMTGDEFAAMLGGKIKFDQGDIRSKLITQLNQQLGLMSTKEREKVLTSLLEFFDGDPSLDTLADPSKVFAGISATLPRGELAG